MFINSLLFYHIFTERLNYGRMSSNSSNNDDEVLTDFVNRNPRNMELLRLARKPQGYGLDISSINYYYRSSLIFLNLYIYINKIISFKHNVYIYIYMLEKLLF